MDRSDTQLFSPGRIGNLTLRNRVIRTAAFEGMSPGGEPSAQLIRHHQQMARGGVALTTLAYCSVSRDGRTFADQLVITPAVVPRLGELTHAVHEAGAAVAVQLGHAGGFAARSVIGQRPIGPSPRLSLYSLNRARQMSESDMDRVRKDFVQGALLSREAGFDAVELHAGHGYLLSQFISPLTNRRPDRFGGSIEDRMRFPLAVLRDMRRALGPDYPLLVKMNLEDGLPQGLQRDEGIETARQFEANGASALVLSGGLVERTSFYMLRGRIPLGEMVEKEPNFLRKTGMQLFGRFFVKTYPFRELFFLEAARPFPREIGIPLVLVGGIHSRQGMDTVLEEGFDFVAVGRPLIMDPMFVRRIERGEITASDCDVCNRCVAEMVGGGIRCVTMDERQGK